jgi:peptide-methionine (R)-S-oxide reductase
MKTFVIVGILSLFFNCKGSAQKNAENKNKPKIIKTDEQCKDQLTPQQYYVLRQAGTERAFSSPLNNNHEKGTYVCAACNTPLFLSEHKFDSGTGWPSFDREIKGNVNYSSGGSDFYGIEEHCAVCGGHLGHVFNDGPRKTTGKRHCINGVALKFIPSEQ